MMNLIPWTGRRREIGDTGLASNFRNQMDRFIDRFLDPSDVYESTSSITTWMPPMEISEHDNEMVVSAELPGVNPEEISVTVSGNQLIVSGEKTESHEDRKQGVYRSERRYGMFRRVIELPQDVDPDNVKAEYAHGVLTLRLPRSAGSQPKRIPVTAGGQSQRVQTQGQQPTPQQTGSTNRTGDGESRSRPGY